MSDKPSSSARDDSVDANCDTDLEAEIGMDETQGASTQPQDGESEGKEVIEEGNGEEITTGEQQQVEETVKATTGKKKDDKEGADKKKGRRGSLSDGASVSSATSGSSNDSDGSEGHANKGTQVLPTSSEEADSERGKSPEAVDLKEEPTNVGITTENDHSKPKTTIDQDTIKGKKATDDQKLTKVSVTGEKASADNKKPVAIPNKKQAKRDKHKMEKQAMKLNKSEKRAIDKFADTFSAELVQNAVTNSTLDLNLPPAQIAMQIMMEQASSGDSKRAVTPAVQHGGPGRLARPSPEIAQFNSLAAIGHSFEPEDKGNISDSGASDDSKSEHSRKKRVKASRPARGDEVAAHDTSSSSVGSFGENEGRKRGEYNVQQRELQRGYSGTGSFAAPNFMTSSLFNNPAQIDAEALAECLSRVCNGGGLDSLEYFPITQAAMSNSAQIKQEKAARDMRGRGQGIAGQNHYEAGVPYDHDFMDMLKASQIGYGVLPITGRTEIYSRMGDVRYNWGQQAEMKEINEARTNLESNGRLIRERMAIQPMKKLNKEFVASIKPKYIRKLYELIYAGKAKKVLRRMQYIGFIIQNGIEPQPQENAVEPPTKSKKNKKTPLSKSINMAEFKRFSFNDTVFAGICKTLISESTHKDFGHSIVHALASHYSGEKGCIDRKHGDCLTLDLLLCGLRDLEPSQYQKALGSKCTALSDRRPIHFAVITGHPCQLDVLLKHGVNPQPLDRLQQTPLLYAIDRNHVTMVRQLMWQGADLNQEMDETSTFPVDYEPPLHARKDEKSELKLYSACAYIRERLTAMDQTMELWMRHLLPCHVAYKAHSNLHIVRAEPDMDAATPESVPGLSKELDASRETLHRGFLEREVMLSMHNIDKDTRVRLWVVAIPFFYTLADSEMRADKPNIARVSLLPWTGGRPIHFIKDPELYVKERYLARPQEYSATMRAALDLKYVGGHNGHYYSWKVPVDLTGYEQLLVKMQLNMAALPSKTHSKMRLMIQVVSIGPA